MSSTFTTPLRIFKRNNPTNNGTIAPDNTGAAMCSQEGVLFAPITAAYPAGSLPLKDVGGTTQVPFILPAGSLIHDIYVYQTTAPSSLTFTGGTSNAITVNALITSTVDGSVTTTAIGYLTPSTTGGVSYVSFAQTAAAATILANGGVLDYEIQFNQAALTAITGTLNYTFSVTYVPRNVDGSTSAYGSGYTNS